jgi:hypothetical protein
LLALRTGANQQPFSFQPLCFILITYTLTHMKLLCFLIIFLRQTEFNFVL